MYHRILPKEDERFNLEEPGMIVTPDTFAMHMNDIKRHFDVISLSDWVNLKQQELPLPKKACAVTFDDGWADNYEYALPVLKATNTPATLFAVAEKIGTNFQFWPNSVLALLLNGFTTELNRHPLFAKVSSQPPVEGPIDREYAAAYIHQLKSFSDDAIFSALHDIRSADLLAGQLPNALMTWEQLNAMHASGLVVIGSHTCNHMRLSVDLNAQQMQYEIENSKRILDERLGAPADLFCFPNGDYNEAALHLVTKTYKAAVTTQRGINDANKCDPHELTRIGIHEEVSNSPRLFGARLSGWL
ncbi:MAG: polysaccharide deacetylase family protein [Gammaproteobacteria bacterium]|nr:MAG: polysaccharide deacetylase family protein [Gammaproteobacteria bacterium]